MFKEERKKYDDVRRKDWDVIFRKMNLSHSQARARARARAVSYTHLTLPTKA